MGSLISTEAMQRCIHCTRCIRVGEEIGGIQEVGMVQRGEHSEITTFVGRAVESELSGNMIDVCPVGALDRKSTRLNSSHVAISYAVFCLKKKKNKQIAIIWTK